MPGSNEYSMSPDLRTNTSDSKPTLVPKSNPTPKVTAPKQPTKSEWKATNATGMVAGDQTYKVKAGNTLGQIVATYNKLNGTKLTWQDVAKWNGVDEKKLKIGQVLKFKPDESTSQTTPTPTPTEVKSNPTAAQTVETETSATPATDKAESDSTQRNSSLVLPVSTGNVVIADPVSRDSSLVLSVDTGNVARTDSAFLSSPNAASVSSRTPVITTRSPRNFNWTGYYFSYPTEEFMREMQ
jgi:LysM repeat protein